MKLKVVILLVTMLFTAVVFAESSYPQNEGALFNLEQYRGKVVLLDFWASWCVPCRAAFPWLNKMHQKYHDLGFEIVAVNLDEDRAQAEAFLGKIPANFTIAYDPKGELAKMYQLQGMPASYLIDKEGKILKSHIGFLDSETQMRESEIKQALGG
jgi:thiol-disulfide isomerase/thioredoxin